jgi:hypothetical protein
MFSGGAEFHATELCECLQRNIARAVGRPISRAHFTEIINDKCGAYVITN